MKRGKTVTSQFCITLVKEAACEPSRKTKGAAGYDVYAVEPGSLAPGQTAQIPLGIASQFEPTHYVQLKARSSLAARGCLILGGVIDSDFRNEWRLIMHNLGQNEIAWDAAERIAQFVILPCSTPSLTPVPALAPTMRGEGGLGSTGRF